MKEIELLNPVALAAKETGKLTVKTYDTLEGKNVAIVWSFLPWRGFELFSKKLRELLVERYQVKEVLDFNAVTATSHGGAQTHEEHQKSTERVIDDLEKKTDCALIGAAFCGSCTYACVEAVMETTKRGVPIVALTNKEFESLARVVCQAKGYKFDDLSWLVLPADINTLPEQEINSIVEERLEEIQEHLKGKTGVL
ncbi:MAG: UGSC family (seleno)protein [Chloroflexota bacterium]